MICLLASVTNCFFMKFLLVEHCFVLKSDYPAFGLSEPSLKSLVQRKVDYQGRIFAICLMFGRIKSSFDYRFKIDPSLDILFIRHKGVSTDREKFSCGGIIQYSNHVLGPHRKIDTLITQKNRYPEKTDIISIFCS